MCVPQTHSIRTASEAAVVQRARTQRRHPTHLASLASSASDCGLAQPSQSAIAGAGPGVRPHGGLWAFSYGGCHSHLQRRVQATPGPA